MNTLGDNELADLRLRAFGFVFQTFNLIPTLNALQNVEAKVAPTGLPDGEMRARSLALLEEVGLRDRADHLPSQLSGGEQQRVAIARALSTEPRVVLADEPTGNLDSRTGTEVVDLLTSLSEERGHTVILVTHDAEIAEKAHRSIRMQDGRLLEPRPPRSRFARAGGSCAAKRRGPTLGRTAHLFQTQIFGPGGEPNGVLAIGRLRARSRERAFA